MKDIPVDPYFRVEVLTATPNPQQIAYAAMHQDYAEGFVWDEQYQRIGNMILEKDDEDEGRRWPDEEDSGHAIVKHLLSGHKGHYGPLEHPQIVFNCGWVPHSVMQQARTHRIASFDVQSFRYSGERLIKAAKESWNAFSEEALERIIGEVVYLRPVGEYTDRQGKRYQYTAEQRYDDIIEAQRLLERYRVRVEEQGFSEEHARGMIPFDVRQHFVVSMNLRSLMHFLCIRGKKDAQPEIQQLCELMLPHFERWAPEVYKHFMENLWLKGRLAP